MKSRLPGSLRVFVRLGLGLMLLVGLYIALGAQAHPVHAVQTLTVTDCTSDAQLQADINTANSDNAGDTITFSCNGDIKLSGTLQIKGSMTLDGSGQSVTLDGQGQVQVLKVNSGVSFMLNALTIAHGRTVGTGGGLLNDGTVSITNSTFANNSSGNPGGGLMNENGGTVSITNSTFANNLVTGYATGGGLFQFNGGTVNITNSTFVNNGGGLWNDGGTMSIGGSIVANNTGSNCVGAISDRGYNLESASDCGFTGAGDLQNADPKLDPNGLQNNGGWTQTVALLQGSPAIDWVASGCPSTDQRGYARPDGTSESKCDIGAYESGSPSALVVSVRNVSATEGRAFSGIVATGTDTEPGTLSATISWGDGSSSAGSVTLNPDGSYSVKGSHTYVEEGSSFALTIQVSVSGGQSATGSGRATVADAALTASTPTAVIKRLTVALTTGFTDADPNGTVSDYTASISWGDGTTSAAIIGTKPSGSGFIAVKSHKYGKHRIYTVKVTVKDAGGSSITKTLKITV